VFARLRGVTPENDAPSRNFPDTSWSAVLGVRSGDEGVRARSLEALAQVYWKPVYKHVRLRWGRGPEDAQDLTQEFFSRALEKRFFDAWDPARGRFRTFLRVCLDGFLANEAKAAGRLKRGGGILHLPLEFKRAEGEITMAPVPSPDTIERHFDAEWARSLFELTVESLKAACDAEGKAISYRIFERYDLEGSDEERSTYAMLAEELRIPITQVTNHLAWARRRFRALLLERLRALCATDEEFQKEARSLLGLDV